MAPDEESKEENSVEFQFSDLRLDTKIDPKELVENIHSHVLNDIGLLESDVSGVHFLPNENWPQRVKIYCNNSDTKDTLIQRGLGLYGRHIRLFEPGQGIKKIEIKNVPGHMPSSMIKPILETFGQIVSFRHEKHRLASGRQIEWTTGNRLAWMRDVENMPPIIKIKWQGKDILLNVWHFGQVDKYCRHCKDIVPKDHQCPNIPQRKCFGCGSLNHKRDECPVGKVCYHCGQSGHIALRCPDKDKPKANSIFTNKTNQVNRVLGHTSFVNGKKDTLFSQQPLSEGATGNSRDLNPPPPHRNIQTPGKRQRSSGDSLDINSEDEFPKVGQTEKDVKGKKDLQTSSRQRSHTGSKKNKKRRKKTQQRSGLQSITSFLKPQKDQPETLQNSIIESESCYETDDELDVHSDVDTDDEEKKLNEGQEKGNPGNEDKEKIAVTITSPGGNDVTVDLNDKEHDQEVIEVSKGIQSMEVDTAEEEKVKVTVFGGSNCENLQAYLTGDEEIKIESKVVFEGGLKFAGISKKIDELGVEHDKNEDDYIVCHVGSSDFPLNTPEELDLKHGQYREQLSKIDTEWHGKHIIMCSVPLRIGSTPVHQVINSQVTGFNKKTQSDGDRYPRLHYCNTVPYLVDKEEVCPDLYKKPDIDPYGVHFNEAGKKEVAKAITDCIKEIAKGRKKIPLPVQVSPAAVEVTHRERASEIVCSEELCSSPATMRNV